MSSSLESLTLLVAQLQQTMFAQTERVHTLEERVRVLEQERARPAVPGAAAAPAAKGTALEVHRAEERAKIISTLEETGWNRLEAARILAMPRRTLYRRMVELGIQEGDSRLGVSKREKERAAAKQKKRATPKRPGG